MYSRLFDERFHERFPYVPEDFNILEFYEDHLKIPLTLTTPLAWIHLCLVAKLGTKVTYDFEGFPSIHYETQGIPSEKGVVAKQGFTTLACYIPLENGDIAREDPIAKLDFLVEWQLFNYALHAANLKHLDPYDITIVDSPTPDQ